MAQRPDPRDPIPFSFKCDARWDDMLGSGQKRLCTRCNTPVVDLSSMTREEARRVLATPGVCVNYIVEGGEVVYANERGKADPTAPAKRAEARGRGRSRRLVRWAGAAASAAVAGGVVVPGLAHAGADAAEQSSTFERLRSWVASWFIDEGCAAPTEVRLGGEPMVVEPFEPVEPVDTGLVEPPPTPPTQRRRYGGKPLPVERRAPPTPPVIPEVDG
jgi:hypothetical protein